MTNLSIKIHLVFLFFLWFSCDNKPATSTDTKTVQTTVTDGQSTNDNKKGNKASANYRLAFYNVENLFDTEDDPKTNDKDFLPEGRMNWTTERYNQKLQNLAKVIKELGSTETTLPAIIGLCEIENEKVLKDLATQLPSAKNIGIVHRDSPDERGIDVALLYDKSVVKILESDFFTVKLKDDNTRDVLYVKTKIDKDEIHVFVNHWSSRWGGQEVSEPKRIASATIVRNKIDELFKENPEAKIVIMGDFNDSPINKSIVEVLKAQKPNNKIQDAQLYNLSQTWHDEGKGTHYYDGWSALDQIIVSGELLSDQKGLHTTPNQAHIYSQKWMTYFDKEKKVARPSRFMSGTGKVYGGYSDHFPVYLELVK